ncbi:MAG: bifunctional salicylyl-CoA 5-hydroxylase/oxidoreductase, partial [Allosphingosinicella sp.]
MRIACLGGGPAGLYFAISMKLREAAHDIHVFERNRADDTFGWGVVFSDQTVENLLANDPASGEAIRSEFAHWDDIEIHIHGETIRSSGHGFIGIGRKRLLAILQERARSLGVQLHFEHEASPRLEDWADFDLVIAADGANSRIRTAYEPHFGVDVQVRRNRFFWFGTPKAFEAFTFAFEETEAGWVWAHAYRFDEGFSTFIVEAPEEVWLKSGLDRMEKEESIAFCERLFAKYLDGHPLLSNASHLR